jgi:hypothetical protein
MEIVESEPETENNGIGEREGADEDMDETSHNEDWDIFDVIDETFLFHQAKIDVLVSGFLRD